MVPTKCDNCPCGPIWTKCQLIDSMNDDDKGIPKPGEKCPWVLLADAQKQLAYEKADHAVTMEVLDDLQSLLPEDSAVHSEEISNLDNPQK